MPQIRALSSFKIIKCQSIWQFYNWKVDNNPAKKSVTHLHTTNRLWIQLFRSQWGVQDRRRGKTTNRKTGLSSSEFQLQKGIRAHKTSTDKSSSSARELQMTKELQWIIVRQALKKQCPFLVLKEKPVRPVHPNWGRGFTSQNAVSYFHTASETSASTSTWSCAV